MQKVIGLYQGKCLSEWAKEIGLHRSTLSKRVKSGMSLEEAVKLGHVGRGFRIDGSIAKIERSGTAGQDGDGRLPPDTEPPPRPKEVRNRRFGAKF